MRFATCPAPASLADAVRELWLLDDDGRFHAGLPKPYVELVVSLAGVHWWRAAPGGREHRFVDAWVTPIQRGPRYARAVGRRCLIGARLQPWAAAALFGPLPPGNGTPPIMLHSLIGPDARRLRKRLIEAADDGERFAQLIAWLEAQAPLRRRATDRDDPRCSSVAALADARRLSPRSLRRRFALDAGIPPKHWLRLHRLDAVLRDPMLGDLRLSLADMAYAHGFADQAHLARETAALAGTTPTALRRRSDRSPPHLLPLS